MLPQDIVGHLKTTQTTHTQRETVYHEPTLWEGRH